MKGEKFLMRKVVSILLATLFLISSSFFGGNANASETTVKDSPLTDEELLHAEKQLKPYIYYEKDGQLLIDLEKAKEDGLRAEYIEIGSLVNQLSKQMDDHENQKNNSSDIQLDKISLPIWGNWCGPGHGGGPAVDVLDAGCRAHDKCYAERGYFNCACDRALVNYINANYSKMKLKEKVAASAIKLYFNNTLCNPF